ncbi:MAG TPA: DUF4416 family protein [Syntrophales bacterium]|nr:DUF4416 family protein [Syntrophales bacterium]HOL58915.1 DUF4416 family protein [Syntrophales bacterium]HPO35242.1 DUF4416 family protein [Syntrophales bacterium]
MSKLKRPAPVKLVMSLLSSDLTMMAKVMEALAHRFGEPDIISRCYPFHYTNYYEREMGAGLARRMVSFAPLVPPDNLPGIKVTTTELEEEWAKEGKRTVNIDPGYMALAHFILATGKGYAHRPYLGRGVYADLTLIYQGGDFSFLPWTYPDYRSPEILDFLRKVRSKYVEQLRREREGE